MSKQKKTTATELVALLNKQYKAIVRNQRAIKTAADSENETDMFSFMKHEKILDAAFEKTIKAIKDAGETVKFDESKGEYFIGAKKYRIEYRMVSVGCVEIEAPTEQIALMKARKMADYDEIDLEVVSGTLTSVTCAA